MRELFAIARREAGEVARGRWLWAGVFLLTALPLLVSLFGLGLEGGVPEGGLARTTASMTSLAIYLVPLVGLQVSHASVVAEAERGTLWLLAAQPLPRWKIVAGKHLGLCALVALLVGGSLGVSGALVAARAGAGGAADYAVLIATSVCLGWCFVGIGLLLSTWARDRAQSMSSSLAAWLAFCLVGDLLLLAVFVGLSRWLVAPDYKPAVELLHRELASGVTGDEVRFPALSALVLVNPTDVFRLWNVLRVPELRAAMALTRSMPPWLESAWVLGAASVFWVGAPLWLACRRFARAEPS